MYGTLSPVVKEPFSDWRLPSRSLDSPTDDSIRDGEKWARSLEEYIERAQGFRQRWYGGFFNGDLVHYIATWRTNLHHTSADDLIKLLINHREMLLKMRQDYASSFIAGGLAKSEA